MKAIKDSRTLFTDGGKTLELKEKLRLMDDLGIQVREAPAYTSPIE